MVTPAELHVRLLGELDLRLGETGLPPLDSARAESLLAYLLLHRDAPQPRQHLAFLLWPDSTEPQARTNLRHVLHNLRRALPDADAASRSRRARCAGGPTRRCGSTSPRSRTRWRGRATTASRPARGGRRLRRRPAGGRATTSGCSRSASACAGCYLDALERLAALARAGRRGAAIALRRAAAARRPAARGRPTAC